MLSEPEGLDDEWGHFKALCVVSDKAQFCSNVSRRKILIILRVTAGEAVQDVIKTNQTVCQQPNQGE